jgi:translation initiation factor 1
MRCETTDDDDRDDELVATRRKGLDMVKKVVADGRPLAHNPFATLQGKVTPSPSTQTPADGAAANTGAPPAAPSSKEARPLGFRTKGKLVVKMERKGHGGKAVTRVSGIHAGDAEVLARDLKKALGTGVRVDDDGTLTVQGDLVDRVVALLEARGAVRIVRG